MYQETRPTRYRTVKRTYPIYAISTSDISDDDHDIVFELKPITRHRNYSKQQKSTLPSEFISENRKRSVSTVESKLEQKSVPTQKEKRKICNHRCLRIFTLILTVFLFIISLLLLIFALNLLLNPNMTKLRSVAIVYANATPSSGFTGKGPTDTLLVTASIGIIIGSIIFLVSILTMIALVYMKFRYFVVYFCIGPVLLIILFLILVGLALFIMITGETELERLAYSTQYTVYYLYNSTSTTLVRDGWDFVQYYFGCCGVKDNSTDWYLAPSTGWIYNSQLPRSCCGYDPNDAGHAGRIFVAADVPSLIGTCYYGDIGQPTCYDNIKTRLLATVLVFLVGVAIIVLMLAIFTCILIFSYRTVHKRIR